jgi:hypothetical protein
MAASPRPWLRERALASEKEHLLEPVRRPAPPHVAHLEQGSGLTGSALTSVRASLDAASVSLRFRSET